MKFDCKVSHQFQQFLDHDRIIQAGNNQYHNQGHGTWNGNRNGNNAHSAQGGPRQQSTTYYESHMSNMGGPPAHQHQQQQHDSYPQSHQQMQQQMHHNEQMYQQANYSAMQNMQTHSLQPMMQNGPFQMSSSPPSTTFQPIQHQSAAMYYGQLMGQPPMNGRHMNQSPAYIPAQNQFQQQNPPIPPMSTMSPIQGMQGVPSMPIQQGMVMQPYQNLVQMMPYMYHPQNALPSGYPPVALNHNMLPPNLPTPLQPQDQHQYEMKSVNTMQYTGNYENSNSSNHVHNPNIVQRFPNAGSGYTNHNNHA